MAIIYGLKASDGEPKGVAVNDDGELVVNLEAATVNIGDVDVLSSALPTGAASESTLSSIKTAVEGATPAGTAIIGKVGIDKTTPGTTNQVTVDGTGQSADIKVSLDSEKVAISGIDAGSNIIGKVGIDQATANANEVVTKSGSVTAATLVAAEVHAGQVGGHISIVTGTLTRPNDTPGAYSAKDEINTSTTAPTYITFSNVARVANGTGIIAVVTKKVNNAGATAQLRLHLYNAAPTPCNDHAAFAQLWADRAKYVGYVDFGAPVVEGTGSDMAMVQVSAINLPFTCAGGSRDLFGRVEVIVAGAAPAASQVWDFQLRALVD